MLKEIMEDFPEVVIFMGLLALALVVVIVLVLIFGEGVSSTEKKDDVKSGEMILKETPKYKMVMATSLASKVSGIYAWVYYKDEEVMPLFEGQTIDDDGAIIEV